MARRHDALIPLSHDHRAALALAFRLHHPAPPGPVTPTTPASTPASRRAETLGFFAQSLRPHFAIEEEVLFPAVRAAHGAPAADLRLVDELEADHRLLEKSHRALETAHGAALEAELLRFADLLEAHVRREERELFSRFPGPLPEREVAALHAEIHRRRPPDGAL